MAAVPSIGRADRAAPEADLTRALYERYATQIFRYCVHELGSREEAEDAVQSTFLNAFRGIKRGIVPEQEAAWLFKIAHNVCLSRRRSTWRRGRIESPADFEVVEELAPAPSRLADELVGLQDVLEQMPENQRRAILLREWQGLSYREIAAELELSQTAVETLIFRARRSLAKGLEEPPAQKRRMIRGADLGNLLTGLKSLLLGGGAAAAKVAAVVAVVGAGTVAVASPAQPSHHVRPQAPPAATPTRATPSVLPWVAGVRPVLARPASQRAARVPAPSIPVTGTRPATIGETVPPAEPPAAPPAADAPAPVTDNAPSTSAPAPAPPAHPAGPPQSSPPPDPAGDASGPPPPAGQGQGQGQGQGNGHGSSDGSQGQGQGQGQGNDPTGSAPTPPTPSSSGSSSSAGNNGNGSGNGSGSGQGSGNGNGNGHSQSGHGH